jgi:hypothetical protein
MVAFLLVGLWSRTGPGVVPRPEPGSASVEAPARTLAGRLAPKASPVRDAWTTDLAPDDDAAAHREEIARTAVASEAGSVTARRPEELGPFAPDVTVEITEPLAGEMVGAHAHVPVGLDDTAPRSDSTNATAQEADDPQGPEPGTWYWFGPLGLDRLKVLAEAAGDP